MAITVFSERLSQLRKARKVTQEQLAQHLGVSAQAVSKWENGSYPDGDLLPRIADFFHVSIDYLYGRDNGKIPIEQQIMDCVKELFKKDKEQNIEQDIRELALNCLWALEISCWKIQKHYYERPRNASEGMLNASLVTDSDGFNYMRLNRDFEYGIIVKEPREGFASYFKVTDELAELFRFLGDTDHLKILFYMLSITGTESVRISTLEKRLSIPAQKVEKALEYLCSLTKTGEGMFYKGMVLDELDRKEVIYSAVCHRTVSVLMLLLGADAMMCPPNSYQSQINSRSASWMKREDLNFLK